MSQEKLKAIIDDIFLVPIVIVLAPLLALAVLAFYVVPVMKIANRKKTVLDDPYKQIAKAAVATKVEDAETSKEVR